MRVLYPRAGTAAAPGGAKRRGPVRARGGRRYAFVMSRTVAIGAWLVVLCGLSGCESAGPRAPDLLAEGEAAYRARQYDTAVTRLSGFLGSAGTQPEAARALYVRGMAYAQTGRRAQAYADLQRAAAQAGDPQVAGGAWAVLGVMRFEDEDWAGAVQALRRAVDQLPAGAPEDALRYRLALALERTGQWSAAQRAFRELLEKFPQGAYQKVAARRLQLRPDHFAVQCGVFASASSADELAAQLRGDGLPAEVRREPRGGETRYVVLAGRYETYAQARKALAQVKARLPDAVLWP